MNKILVVDGQEWVTDHISRLLTENGYEVMTAESGHNTMTRIEVFKPDLVLLDLELPDISGYDVCKTIKNDPATKYIMVLCTTSLETREMSVRVVEAGADDFTEKNIAPALLLMKIKSLLRIKNLSDQLKIQFAELEEKNKIREFQLQMGQQIQRSLMPSLDLRLNNVSLSSRYMPAFDIGGDFYNFVKINSNCVGILIGDVSGHGISAALLTAMFSSMVFHTKNYYKPDEMLYQINREYCEIFENSTNTIYTSIFYAVIDTLNNVICYSNAGSPLPFLARYSEGDVIELEASGLPVGMDEDPSYEYKTISFNRGDLLLLHTDGLHDTFYKDKPEEFTQRIKASLFDSKGLETKEIADAMLSEFYNLNPSNSEKYALDDVSVVVCRL
jgi:sigma-B regulation protein RsbU (phosphoserine phosphatase)